MGHSKSITIHKYYLAMFEEGVALVKLCNARLDAAEQKVKILTVGPDGNLTENDMK